MRDFIFKLQRFASIFNHSNNTLLTGTADADQIYNHGLDYVTINAGSGNDSVTGHGDFVEIDMGYGDDSVDFYGVNVTVEGGTGDDSITNPHHNARGAVYVYKSGDGNDTINGLGITDTVLIASGSWTTTKSGNDIIVTVGNGSITLKDAKAQPINFIDANGQPTVLTVESVPDEFLTYNDKKTAVTLSADFDFGSLAADDYDSKVSTIDAAAVSDAIEIFGNDKSNFIVANLKSTVHGGKGNDTLTGGTSTDIFIYESGNDTITDYASGEKISVNSARQNFRIDGDDVIICFADGSLTINDALGKKITFVENGKTSVNYYSAEGIFTGANTAITLAADTSTFTASTKIVTIDGGLVSDAASIVGNSKANKIFAGDAGSTLNGGMGKDTLIGGNGSDIFVYENKSGNDVIQNFGAGDKVSISGAKVTDASISGGNTVLKIGNNFVTVQGATEVSFTDSDGDKLFKDGLIYDASQTSATLGSAVKNFDASTADVTYITGNGKANQIIANSDGSTLVGGRGTDSLWGSGGADTFLYTKGDGKDFIYGFGDNDLLEISGLGTKVTGTFNRAGDELTVKVGTTTVAVLKDFSATTFNVTADGTNYQLGM